MRISRRLMGVSTLVALLLGFAITTQTAAAATPPHGSLTLLHGKGYCLGAGCTALRGFPPVNGKSQNGDAMVFKMSTNGRTLFAIGGYPGAIAILARNPKTGKLTQLPGKLGCVSAQRRSDCAYLPRLHGAYQSTISGDGSQIALEIVAPGNNLHAYLYARNVHTGAVKLLSSTLGCEPLLNGGPCLDGPGGAGANDWTGTGTEQLNSNLVASVGWDNNSGGELALWWRTSTRAPWQNATGIAGCVSSDGSSGCLKAPCMDWSPNQVILSHDGSKLYVAGGDSDPESTSGGYLATFQLGSGGTIEKLLGCVSTGADRWASYVPIWMHTIGNSNSVLIMEARGSRSDGYAWEGLYIAKPNSSGALQKPVVASKYVNTMNFSTDLTVSKDGKTVYLLDPEAGWDLTAYRIGSSKVTELPKPWGLPYVAPSLAGYGATDQALSADGKYMYLAIGASSGSMVGRAPEIHVYKVN